MIRRTAGGLLTLCWLALFVAEATAAPKDAAAVFARVGDVVITQQEYDQAFAAAARNKFYHGKPPEGEVAKLQREVADNLVNDILLTKEAKRRKIQPDAQAVQKELDAYEARYRNSEMWKKNKDTMLPPLRKKLEDNTILEQLQKSVRGAPVIADRQVEAYYEKNKDKFTEPEQVHLSIILLKVDPSSPQSKWNAAMDEGQAITKRLRGGADFAQLAHLHSGDASAEKGGNMGYLHHGMLPEPAQVAVDKMQPGSISDPVQLLEGIAVFKLHERKPAKLNPLANVRQRAHDLAQRDAGDQAWAALLAKLRKDAQVKVDESRFLPLPPEKPASAAAASAK